MLRAMDYTLELCNGILGGMLLEHSGLSRFEQNMELTVTNDATDIESRESPGVLSGCLEGRRWK